MPMSTLKMSDKNMVSKIQHPDPINMVKYIEERGVPNNSITIIHFLFY